MDTLGLGLGAVLSKTATRTFCDRHTTNRFQRTPLCAATTAKRSHPRPLARPWTCQRPEPPRLIRALDIFFSIDHRSCTVTPHERLRWPPALRSFLLQGVPRYRNVARWFNENLRLCPPNRQNLPCLAFEARPPDFSEKPPPACSSPAILAAQFLQGQISSSLPRRITHPAKKVHRPCQVDFSAAESRIRLNDAFAATARYKYDKPRFLFWSGSASPRQQTFRYLPEPYIPPPKGKVRPPQGLPRQ